MKLGLIGRGPFGQVYAKTLTEMGIEFVQYGQDWDCKGLDGVIIASKAESHFLIAKSLILARMPVLIEKPIAMSYKRAVRLLEWAEEWKNSIVFVSHTRLYSKEWVEFKNSLPLDYSNFSTQPINVLSIEAQAGSRCKVSPKWDWGPHLVAMTLDLGFDPLKAKIRCENYEIPFKFVVNGQYEFNDPPCIPTPLTVMIGEFVKAIEKGEQNIEGLKLGVLVTQYLSAD